MSTQGRKPSKGHSPRHSSDRGPLLDGFEAAFGILHLTSLGRRLEKNHPDNMDYYILGWFIFQIILVVCLAFLHFSSLMSGVVIGLLAYRLFEIGINTFDSIFILVMVGKRHSSIPRLVALILSTYAQVIIAFGIILYFLMDQSSLITAFYTSVSLSTLAGANLNNPTAGLLVAVIFEMLMGTLFVAGAIAAVANYLGNKE